MMVLLSVSGVAQSVVLTGNASSHAGMEIAVFETQDYISGMRTLVNFTRIEDDGTFRMEFDREEKGLLTVQVANLQGRLYAEPGETYSFVFPPSSDAKILAFDYIPVSLEMLTDGQGARNKALGAFDVSYGNFLDKHENELHMLRSSGSTSYSNSKGKPSTEEETQPVDAVDSQELIRAVNNYRATVKQDFKTALQNEFFRAYTDFAFARLLYACGEKREQIYRDFLVDAPVHVDNPMYATFIEEFYHDFFRATDNDTKKAITKAVNARRSYAELDSVSQGDITLGEDGLRQYVLTNALKEAFYIQGFSRDGVFSVLQQQSETAEQYPVGAEIATNVTKTIKKGLRGYEVPDFEILDHLDDRHKLSDFRGKYVYIGFFTSGCESCDKELMLMNKIKTKNPFLEVISINMDYSHIAFKTYVHTTAAEYDWKFLYGPSDRMIRDYLPLRTVPEYFLIDPEGKLMYNYTRKPSEGISQVLEGIRKKASGDKKPSTEPPRRH